MGLSMTFQNDVVPPGFGNLNGDINYGADTPFNVKQAALTTRRHRWFDPRPMNVGAGQTVRFVFDNRPDFIEVSISGQTAATGRANVYMGEPGGNAIGPCGPGADIVMPCPHDGVVSVVNLGSTATIGVVLGIAGYTDPGVKITLGN
jgi:hypothetical protein